MPNPFPGMDPYLEGPLWTTVHNNLIEEIAWQLAPKVSPKYVALTNQRVTVATPDPLEMSPPGIRVPDVGIYDTGGKADSATVATSAPLVMDALFPENMTQTFIEIRDVADRNLVTAIEVLSLSNKRGDGLEEYRQKRREMIASKSHFLEIDLLRAGERYSVAGVLPSTSYFAFLSRANRRSRVEIWPISLDQSLPTVPVPLLAGDPDVQLDLQDAFQTIYEHYRYDQSVNHSVPPPLPLSPELAAWAQERLRGARGA